MSRHICYFCLTIFLILAPPLFSSLRKLAHLHTFWLTSHFLVHAIGMYCRTNVVYIYCNATMNWVEKKTSLYIKYISE